MDSTLWKINSTNASTFATGVQFALDNQMKDSLGFNVDGEPFDSAAFYAYGDAISLYKGEVRKFAGVVVAGPRFGNPTMENHAYEASGLWWYLEQLTFEQEWRAGEGSLNKSHVILGEDIDGNYISVGSVIKEVLDFAIGKGAPFTYSASELTALSAVPPSDEQTDRACSEVVQTMLRWIPDTVAWFDYEPGIPVLHFTRRAAAAAVQLPTIGDTESIEIRDRSDLVQAGVIINYERIDTVDGERIPAIYQDVYPAGTSAGFDTAGFTINIAGSQISRQTVEVEVITEWNRDFAEDAFWKEHVPELIDKSNLIVTEPGGSGVNLPNILKSGQVPKWTNKSTGNWMAIAKIGYEDENGSKVEASDYSVNLELTDAETTTYSREITTTAADPYPEGLAQMLYEALSVVHWQGSFVLIEEEVSATIHPGNVLNLTGGLAAWSTMNAVVQRVTFDVDKGRTTIDFGPPERLALAD